MSRRRCTTIASLLAAALLAAPAARAAEPPPNDDVADAVALSLPAAVTADLTLATLEPTEPANACTEVASTVWYSLEVAQETAVLVDTAGSAFDTAVVVWPGDLTREFTACFGDAPDGSPQATGTFLAQPGVRYLLQVASQTEDLSAGGTLALGVSVAPKLVGKPTTFGTGTTALEASAVWLRERARGGFHNTRVLVMDNVDRTRRAGSTTYRAVSVESLRLTVRPDGTRIAEDWFGTVELGRRATGLGPGLRGFSVDLTVPVERFRCVTRPGAVEPVCGDLPPESAEVHLVWTPVGPRRHDATVLVERALGYRMHVVTTTAWRDARVRGTVVAATPLTAGPATQAAITRDAARFTEWSRQ